MSDTPNDPTAALASTATIARRSDLVLLAVVAMQAHGLAPEFSSDALAEMAAIAGPSQESGAGIEDMRALLWCSIDDDDSQDIDQLSVCQETKDGWRVLVAIADVDALVHKDSAIDLHAQVNTASVYTAARVFPMLPERLSTDLTSLGAHQERLAIVTEMVVDAQGLVSNFRICRAQVRNQAKLAYDSLAAWLDGHGELPAAARAVPGMDAQLRGQDAAAQALRQRRTAQGALQFETFEPRAQVQGEQVIAILQREHNRARQLIEEFMVATNICTAQFLEKHGGLAMRRVVRSPERWSRVVDVAEKYGESLPAEPDSKARRLWPLWPGDSRLCALYAHSTAPNRRYPDLISHRLVKAVLADQRSPYSVPELQALAEHCNRQESAAKKVERSLRKSEAALFLQNKVGAEFDAIVTGKNNRGVWVRTLVPPVEGKLVNAGPEVDVGERVRVKLLSTDVARGFIDFAPTL